MEEELMPIEEIKAKVNENMFAEKKVEEEKPDKKNELVESMFDQAVVHQVANNEELKNNVLETAKKFTETKMQTIKTNVDTEFLEANFNNKKDACESYGFNEKTTPIWATKIMTFGYSIMLSIWLFIGTFTFMPIIFVAKKLVVGLKKTWVAVLIAILIYLAVTLVPIVTALLK